MTLYVISWMDKPGSLDVRMAAREAHLAFAHSLGDRVKLGGPYLDEAGNMAGSLIVVEAGSLEEVQGLHDQDPYKQAGLFETSTITPWRVTLNGFV